MKEVKKEVKTYIVHAMCDCGGEYLPTGMALTSHPVQYPHVCDKCGDKQLFSDEMYPRTEYEEVQECDYFLRILMGNEF